MIARYGIDLDRLALITEEGQREKWPLWDGLSDERGPIPVFGPAGTDRHGRISMTDEERDARRDAAIRTWGSSSIGTVEKWGCRSRLFRLHHLA